MSATDRLTEALERLLAVEDFSQITVSELCKVADVHRTTFYAHYENTVELLQELKRRKQAELVERSRGLAYDIDSFDRRIFVVYLQFVRENADFYRAYMKNSAILDSEDDFETVYETHILPSVRERFAGDETSILYYTRFFLTGLYEVIRMWIDGGFAETPEEMADTLVRIRVD